MINIGIAGGISPHVQPLDVIIGTSYAYHDVNPKQLENLFSNMTSFSANPFLFNLFTSYLPNLKKGVMVSGERFIASQLEKERIIEQFNPLSVDMETGAIAHTSFINDLPFVSLRCLSDLADNEATESYETNEILASNLVSTYLLTILTNFPR